MKLEQITKIAEEVKATLAPFCKRIEIAGSIRREKPECKDIEVVCIPDKSGVPLAQYFLKEKTIFKKNGKKYKQFSYGGVNVDLFITDVSHYGLTLLIRTGSLDFNKSIIAHLKGKGYIMKDGKISNAANNDIHILEEKFIFELINKKYIEPKERI